MIRSMMLVCALGALGAVGCVGTSDAADETAVAQNTGGGGALFDCNNVASISVVQCVGTLLNLNLLNIDVKDVRVLDDNEIKVLNDDLNNLNIGNINILNVTNVLNIVKSTVLSDFLNKFDIDVTGNKVGVCAPILGICI
jgi:hypothetical protein